MFFLNWMKVLDKGNKFIKETSSWTNKECSNTNNQFNR